MQSMRVSTRCAFLFFSLVTCFICSSSVNAAIRNQIVPPLAMGPFVVGSTNFTIDNAAATQLLNSGGNAGFYQSGTVSNGQMHYINELLAFPNDALNFQLQVPVDSFKYGASSGASLPYSGYVLYPTTANNARANYAVFTVPPALPHMQSLGETPIFENATTQYPLIVYSHGDGDHPTARHLEFLIKLASHGYIVMALYHGDGRFKKTDARRFSLRPLAVKTALDIILAHPDFAAHIDPARIGGAGESFGGATMLALLGAKTIHADPFSVINNALATTTVDSRIKAAATMVPYFGQGLFSFFGRNGTGTKSVNRPFLANSSNADDVTDYTKVQAGLNNIPGVKYLVEYKGELHHMSVGAFNDAYTWSKIFLDAFIKKDAAAITALSRMQSVIAGNNESLVLVTEPASNTMDTDGDGVLDTLDAFPLDPAASVDTDGDGHPDSWNTGKVAADSTSTPPLTLDAFPNDATRWLFTPAPATSILLGVSLGDVNGNGSGDFAVLGKRKSSGKYVVRVKDPNTVPHLIREIGLNGAYKPVQMVKLPDMNANGSSEIAVLEVDPITGLNRQIQVKDGRTGVKIVNIQLKQSLKPVQMVVLPDANGNGSADLAVLEVDPATGLNRQIQVKDGRTGALIQNIRVSTSVKPHMLVSVGLINGVPALALSEVDAVTGKNVQIQVKNARTGAKIVNIRVKGSVRPHMLVALPDVNGNGSPDLALSEVDAVTGKNVQIQVKDGKTGALIQNIRVNTSVKPHILVSVGNINAVPALALSEVNAVTGKNVQIQVKNARTGAKIRNITVSRNYKPNSMIVLADINGNGAPELALSEVNATTGKIVQVQVKDSLSGAKIRNIPMNPNYAPWGMETGPDSNGNGVQELGVLEQNAAGNVQVQIKDALTGGLITNLQYPKL